MRPISGDEVDPTRGPSDAITRRDFVNGALVGAGAALLGAAAPGHAAAATDTFTGYGGVGDYSRANGNTFAVVQAAHRMRDGVYSAKAIADAPLAEKVDLVVVGGGIAGLSAAYYFAKKAGANAKRVLLLENHSIFGGEARQNEFLVGGERLLAPQGSNLFSIPTLGDGTVADAFFTEFGIPRTYEWQKWDPTLKPIRFVRDNTSIFEGRQETHFDTAYFFSAGGNAATYWRRDIWRNGLKDTPYSDRARQDLMRWRADCGDISEAEKRHLDTINFKYFLETVRGYDPAVTQFITPLIGDICGVSPDAVSARRGRTMLESPDESDLTAFPGGNAPFARALLRGLLPKALPGTGFNSLMYGNVDFQELNSSNQSTRLMLECTVLRVQHTRPKADGVEVTYEKGGRLSKVHAKAAIVASGGWVNRHILADMPDDLRAAYQQFCYAPALIVNVALKQWRFLYDMGVTACRWIDIPDGFGWVCNIRQVMVGDAHNPPLHPDKPIVLTFYTGIPIPGLPAAAQGAAARGRLLSTSYADYEFQVRRQMTRLFGDNGFKADRDIAGIILNRWGHARLIEPPGFYYGTGGGLSPLERVRQGYGRVFIAHSELAGTQGWDSAVEYGQKAAEQAAHVV